jgi:hypothetical protein
LKYHAIRTQLDGYTFDSKAEAKRYAELRLLERAGEIRNLTVHPRYPLEVNEVRICVYVGDFSYNLRIYDPRVGTAWWKAMVEDVKGVKTPAYRLKKKLFEAIHPGWTITEVKVK